MADVSPDLPQPPETAPTVGQILRDLRQARGYSLEQLAVLTHLRPERIAGLENDEFHPPPYRAYDVGHIRIFARGLEADPTAALDALVRQGGTPVEAINLSPQTYGWRPSSRVVTPALLVLALGLIAIALLLLGRGSDTPSDPTVPPSPTQLPVAPAFESAEGAVPTATVVLSIAAREAAFVEAIVDGQTVFSSEVAAGEIHTWAGIESARLRTDNASALQISIDGESIGELAVDQGDFDRTWFPAG